MKSLVSTLLLISVLILSGCEGSVNIPASSNKASQTPLVSPPTTTNKLGDNPYDLGTAVEQATGYSVSVDIKWYATGETVSMVRDDPRYAEFTKLFKYSTYGQPISHTDKTSQNEKGETITVTVPYAWGYVLTFTLKDSSTVWFNCSVENTWYESADTINKGGFNEDFRAFLEATLSSENKPEPNPAGITIQPEIGHYLYRGGLFSSGTILRTASVRPAVLEKDYMDLRNKEEPVIKKGEPCWLITGQIESQLDRDKYMTMVARGYDVNNQEVAHVIDTGPIWGVISVFLPAKGFGGFIIHLNAAPEVTRIQLFPSPDLYDMPPP